MQRKALGLLLAAACLVHAAPSWAGPTFTVTGVSVVGDQISVTAPVGPATTTAGPITLQTTIGTLVAWCVDLYHDVTIASGQSLSYQIGTVTTNYAPSPSTLTASQVQTIGQLAEYGQSLIGTVAGTNDALAAVQLAIWKTEYSDFTYTGASGASVSNALAAARSFSSADVGLIALSGTQTFVTASRSVLPTVPEPASLLLLGVGASAAFVVRRRRQTA